MNDTLQNKNLDVVNFFKKGTVIFAEGKISKNLYLIKSGEVRLLKNKGSKLISLGKSSEREILNDVAVLTNKPNYFSAIAETDVELVLVNSKDIHTILDSGPKWVEELLETLCERLLSVQEVVEEHQMKNSQDDPHLVLTKEKELEFQAALRSYLADK
jgi:CRP-like cAMP-binding protein